MAEERLVMSTEVTRTDYGMTDKGNVTLITFNNSDDEGNDVLTYQVRHGVRTVSISPNKSASEQLAKSLVATGNMA